MVDLVPSTSLRTEQLNGVDVSAAAAAAGETPGACSHPMEDICDARGHAAAAAVVVDAAVAVAAALMASARTPAAG